MLPLFKTRYGERLHLWKSCRTLENSADVNIAEFGAVPVLDMVDYYLENPPIVDEAGSDQLRQIRFQGC